jgi:5'-methylthioadenosine phosphorylase
MSIATLAIIGGSGFYKLDGFSVESEHNPETPWGHPSSPITVASSASGFKVAFLARHGIGHHYTPSEVPSRANIAALKSLGVKAILAFSAVGSLQEHIKPEDFVVPTQIVDRTKGIRPSTFFSDGVVGHCAFADPFDPALTALVAECKDALSGEGVKLHTRETEGADLTIICMEGPQFSTRAESNLYRSWGGSVINMSVLPEAKLAREAEIAYSMVCMATDYDCWKTDEAAVTVEAVMKHVHNNTANAGRLAKKLVEHVEQGLQDGSVGKDLAGSMKWAVMTGKHKRNPEAMKKLAFLLPGYYD